MSNATPDKLLWDIQRQIARIGDTIAGLHRELRFQQERLREQQDRLSALALALEGDPPSPA